MKYRKLGNTGLEVSEIGFGAWAIGGDLWGEQDDRHSIAALDRCFELGVSFYDTALVYGRGRSEQVIGRWVKERGIRDRVVIASKVPPMNYRWPATSEVPISQVFTPAHIVKSANLSLKNLGLETIDLLQLHVWTERFLEDDGWWEAMSTLKREGKIRAIGVSINSFQPASALGLVEKKRADALQVYHNVFEQRPEDELYPKAHKAGVGIISRVPLDESALTGKLRLDTKFQQGEFRAWYFAGDKLRQAVERAEAVRPILEKAAGTMAAGSLRYCLSSPHVSTVIPGIRTLQQADENTAASDAGPLPKEVIAALRAHRWDRSLGEW
jgi:aryl-alcohol dehydrogenase-like predicted oxidoreductase